MDDFPTGCQQGRCRPVNALQTVFAVDRDTQRFALARKARHRLRRMQPDNLFLTVLQHDVIIAVDQVMPAAHQAAHRGHRRRVNLLTPRHTQLITHLKPHSGVVLAGLPLTVLRVERQQRHRRVVDPRGDRMRVTLPSLFTKQSHLIAIILLVSQLAPQLRQHRQPGLCPDIPAVGRTFFIVRHIRRVFPTA